MKNFGLLITSVGVLTLLFQTTSTTQAQSTKGAKTRLVTELTDSGNGALTLSAIFYDVQPNASQAEETLRHCLQAATVVHPDKDIVASAWFQGSDASSARQGVELLSGKKSLMYVAKDQAIQSSGDKAVSVGGSTEQAVSVSTVLQNEKIVKACKKFPHDQLPELAGVGFDMRGQDRKGIVKAMHAWCKENDVEKSRRLSACITSISKVVAKMEFTTSESPANLDEILSRGEASYTSSHHCINCHGASGRGGSKGPSLADGEWFHCDGSIACIKKMILSGVPLNKLHDASRTFPMRPSNTLASNKEELTDLATYVHSLGQH